MDRFLLMQCFARAVETGSFSAAARDLGLSQPNVSRYVAALEARLGHRLLHRSTRKLHLTPEGERYYGEARRILDAVADAESALTGEVAPAGLLRVACPTALAHEFVMPHVPEFLRTFPKINLDLQISDRFVDLVDEGVEVALRIGHLDDSALRARRVGTFQRICVASPDYLERNGTPTAPEQLGEHSCIIYSLLSTGATWRFTGGDVPVSGRLRVNSPQAVRDAVLAGLGVALGPHWLFGEALRTGALRRILAGQEAPTVPIHLLYASNRLVSRRANAFMDFMAAAFSSAPSLNVGRGDELSDGGSAKTPPGV